MRRALRRFAAELLIEQDAYGELSDSATKEELPLEVVVSIEVQEAPGKEER